MKAAAKAGVEKVLYVSTGGTIGFSTTPDAPRTEADYNTDAHTPYFIGKIAAEKRGVRHRRAREASPVTAINPGLILGPRFWKPSESIRQVLDFLNNGVPVYFDGGFGVVDVEDVATGALLAMDKGAIGERYILSGENVTVKQPLRAGGRAGGRLRPRRGSMPGARSARHRHRARGRQLGHRLAPAASIATRWTSSRGVYGYFDPGQGRARARLHVAQRARHDPPHGGLGARPRLRRRGAARRARLAAALLPDVAFRLPGLR